MKTRGATGPTRIVSQVAEVHKALLSITRAADVGYECHLNAKGGYLLDTWNGERVPIARKGSLYVMRAWVKDDPNGEMRMGTRPEPTYFAQGFARQG